MRPGETSLTRQLYEDRPLLKPIAFVPSKLPSLFLNEEEIFKPMAEEAGRDGVSLSVLKLTFMSSDEQEASHAPTADRVFRIFHRSNLDPNSSGSPSGAEIPEIDFMDLGRIMNEIEVLEVEADSSKNDVYTNIKMAEDQTTTKTVEELFMGDRIDTKPSPEKDPLTPANRIPVERPGSHILGADVEDDDDIIVYVAPYPRTGMQLSGSIPSSSAAVATIPPLADSESLFEQVQQGTIDPPSPTAPPAEPALEHIPTPSSSLKLSPVLMSKDVLNAAPSGSSRPVRRVRRPRVSTRRVNQHIAFGSFGAIRAEAALREVDPQQDEQRCGDSDIYWGGSTSEGSLEDGDMLVDQDVDFCAMEAFVKGMSIAGSAQVTADELEDEARIRDEGEDEEKSDGESAHESDGSTDQYDEESESAGETRIILISDEGDLAIEDDLVESEGECTSGDEESPKGSFQARLERLRKQTQGRPIMDVLKDELDGVGELEAKEEDSIIARLQVMRSKSPNVSLVTHAFTTGVP